MKSIRLIPFILCVAAPVIHGKTVTATGDYSPSPATPNYWGINGDLKVGDTGTGSIFVGDGGEIEVNAGYTYLGVTASGVGMATIEGAGSKFDNPILTLGQAGKGVLNVSQQGLAFAGQATIAKESTGNGEVNVTGGGSIFSVSTGLIFAEFGQAKATISAGGKMSSSASTVGRETGSQAEITVTGAGSNWNTNNTATIAIRGHSKVTVMDGAEANATTTILGSASEGIGEVLVTGGNSSWISTDFFTGDSGTGTLTVAGGGTIKISGHMVIGNQAGSHGTLNIGSYDLLQPTTAGTVQGAVGFGSGTGVINFNQTDTTTFAASVSGGGSVVQRGSGTTILTGTNTMTGPTTVAAGKLAVNGTLDKSVITVKSGAVLGGTGHLGKVIVEEGGKVSPGNSIGTLNAESFLWEEGAVLEYELGATSSDSINVTEDFSKDGAGSYSFQFINDGWQVGFTYTLVTFGETNFTVGDFSFTNAGGFDGDFVLNGNSLTFTVTSVPEPSTWAMVLASGFVIAFGLRRKRY